ncbi:MAG: ABC transporter substrate-binding protein [Nitriliruptorales bacterium]
MRRTIFARLLILTLLGAACAGGGGEQLGTATDDRGIEVRMAAPEDTWPPEGQDFQSTTFAYPLNVNVYEPLIYLGSDYSLQPGLAERWELVPPNTWRFHLRRGVQFHDGRPLTANDVMWSWAERQMQGQKLTTVTNTLGPDSVKKVDDFTVDFTPRVPNLRLPEQIVHPEGAIVPRGNHFDSDPPIGTGPFRVVEYRPRESVTVERFDGYWGEKPQVKRIHTRFLPDPQTRVEALRAGEVDFVIDLPATAVESLTAGGSSKVVSSKPGRNDLIYSNKTGQAPFDLGADRTIRQAVSLALDRQAYVDAVYEGNAEPGRWMAPSSVLGASADIVRPVPYDPGRARGVLDAAGWQAGPDGIRVKNGRPLSLALIGTQETPEAALLFIQAQLREVGIAVEIKKTPDRPTRNNLYNNTQFDLDLEPPNQNDGNPAFLPVLRMYSKNREAFRFAPGGEFDVWAERALAATSREEVQRASAEMMRILIHDEFIVVPMAGIFRIYGMTPDVGLGDPHPSQTNQSWVSLTKTG